MTTTTHSLHFEIRPRRSRRKREWRRAYRALRELLDDPDRTQLAFEIVEALDGNAAERAFLRMLAEPEGRRVFERRPSLLAAVSDRETLARLPEDSFGRAYLAHIDKYRLDPAKLVELGRKVGTSGRSSDAGVRWMSERDSVMHDLWHVLTGYGADNYGEAALLAFSLAQNGGRGNALLTVGASLRVTREVGPAWLAYVFRAWRRGRRALCLVALPYEELLARPLDEVREAVGIEPPELAHPGGVYAG